MNKFNKVKKTDLSKINGGIVCVVCLCNRDIYACILTDGDVDKDMKKRKYQL